MEAIQTLNAKWTHHVRLYTETSAGRTQLIAKTRQDAIFLLQLDIPNPGDWSVYQLKLSSYATDEYPFFPDFLSDVLGVMDTTDEERDVPFSFLITTDPDLVHAQKPGVFTDYWRVSSSVCSFAKSLTPALFVERHAGGIKRVRDQITTLLAQLELYQQKEPTLSYSFEDYLSASDYGRLSLYFQGKTKTARLYPQGKRLCAAGDQEEWWTCEDPKEMKSVLSSFLDQWKQREAVRVTICPPRHHFDKQLPSFLLPKAKEEVYAHLLRRFSPHAIETLCASGRTISMRQSGSRPDLTYGCIFGVYIVVDTSSAASHVFPSKKAFLDGVRRIHERRVDDEIATLEDAFQDMDRAELV